MAESADTIVDELVQMRARALMRDPWLKNRALLLRRLRKLYRETIRQASSEGRLEVMERKGRIRAALWDFKDRGTFGIDTRMVHFDFTGPVGARWVLRRLRSRKARFDSRTFIFLTAPHAELQPALLRQGFSIESLVLVGKPRTALEGLMREHDPSLNLKDGLRIRRIRRDDVAAVVRLHRSEFGRNPQFGWFCATSSFLLRLKKDLLKAVRDPRRSHYVIVRGTRVLGYFGSDAQARTTYGKTAGMSLVFHRSIQGRGLAKTAYRMLLEDMVRKRVHVFKGGTAQPPVMGLSKAMNRKLQLTILRFHPGYFRSGHFRY